MLEFEFSPQCRRCPAHKNWLNLLGLAQRTADEQERMINQAANEASTRTVGGVEVDSKTALELSVFSVQQQFNMPTPQQRVEAYANVLKVLSEASTVCNGPRRVRLTGKLCGMEQTEMADFPFKDELGRPETVHLELVRSVLEAENAATNLKFNQG